MRTRDIYVGLRFALGAKTRGPEKRWEGLVLGELGSYEAPYAFVSRSFGTWPGSNCTTYPCAVLDPELGWIPARVERNMMWGTWEQHMLHLKQHLKTKKLMAQHGMRL